MKTFEEWRKNVDWEEMNARKIWNAAREDMIPADHAIEIPDEKLWPADAECIEVRYLRSNGDHINQVVPNVFRSKVVWVPKPTDKVFVLINGHLYIGVIFSVTWNENECRELTVKSGGLMYHCGPESVRLFSPDKFGLPWDQI